MHHTTTPPPSSTPNSLMDISQLHLNIRARQQQFDLPWGCLLCIYTTTFPKASIRIVLSILVFGSFQINDRFQDLKALFISELDEYPEHCCNYRYHQAYSAIRWIFQHHNHGSPTHTNLISYVLGRLHMECLEGKEG